MILSSFLVDIADNIRSVREAKNNMEMFICP